MKSTNFYYKYSFKMRFTGKCEITIFICVESFDKSLI